MARRRSTRRYLLAAVIAAIAAAWIVGGCQPPAWRPNVILVSIDTLRADALGSFDYERETSPNMDAFLGEAVSFKKAYAPEPHTLPTHVTLMTSLHPLSHGVEARLSGGRPVAEKIPTLAAVLHQAGYATAAFINGGFLHPRFGLGRGFQLYDYFSDVELNSNNRASPHGRSAAETNAVIFDWLDEREDRPFFLFVHYFDVHSDWDRLPYDSPKAYREMFCTEPAAEPSDGETYASAYLAKVNQEGKTLGSAELEYTRSLYDAGVRYTDDRFGELLAGLHERGLYDDALVILVSDHGEEFMEHGKMLHTQLFEECLHVPLGLKFPRRASVEPRQHHEYVELVDVMPTVLDVVGLPLPPDQQGRSLVPLVRGAEWQARPLYFYSSITGQIGISFDGWKLHYEPASRAAQLYDLRNDPQERVDLGASRPGFVVARLQEFTRWYTDRPTPYVDEDPDRVDLDPETKTRLRSLGYVH